MSVLWGTKSGDEILDQGYLNCPYCHQRQPAVLTRHVESSHIYFITIRSRKGPERLRCLACGGYCASDEDTAFGHEEKMPDWKCFKCKQPVPHSYVECPHCGFRFTI